MEWISVEERRPKCNKAPNAVGVPVLIHPPYLDAYPFAYYGCRQSDEPNFYLHGAVIRSVTHWMPLPPPPEE